MSVSGKSLDLLCCSRSGGSVVIQSPRFTLARFATLGALAAALVLAGCGRKGGLDAPPMAAAGDLQANGQGPAQGPTAGPSGKPVSPAVEKRKTILDWLID
jgi:predicted small lipoprotein YifL